MVNLPVIARTMLEVFSHELCTVLGQDRSETKKIGLGLGLGLACLMLCCKSRSCYARCHNDLEGHSNFSSTIYSFSILCLEHHYCGDQQWRLIKS